MNFCIRLTPFLFFVGVFQIAKAQNTNPSSSNPLNTYLNNYVQPPPNAASLGKYADYPVGYYTGVPQISVPLYTLKDDGINLPISLSYHASGIRVSEIASWVGLGWALNATGVINRTVRGGPDEGTRGGGGVREFAPGGYYLDHGLFGLTQFLPCPNGSTGFKDQNGVPATSNTFYSVVAPAVMSGAADCEPDLYTFNFNGHTGKFVFDEKGIPHLLEDDDLKISVVFNPSTNTFTSWEIITPDGLQYYFGENNTAEYVYPHSNVTADNPDSALPANWYLTRIVNPATNMTATFNYVRESYSYNDLGPENQLYGTDANSQFPASMACQNYNINNNGANVSNFITTHVVGLRLASIVTNNFTVKFIANTIRNDISSANSVLCQTCNPPTLSARSLDSIKIYANLHNACIKQFALGHSYFVSTNSSTAPAVLSTVGKDTTDALRLKLLNVTEISGDGTLRKNPYVFSYIESYPGYLYTFQLPRRLSYDQDHWGFANWGNGTRNPFFTPTITYTTCSGSGALRSPSWPDMAAFTLKSIQDPLGASTTFTYGPNSAANFTDPVTQQPDTLVGGLRIQQIAVTDNVTGVTKYRTYNYDGLNSTLPAGIVTKSPTYILSPFNDFYNMSAVYSGQYQYPEAEYGGYAGDYYTVPNTINQILKQSQSIVPMQDANGNHIVYPYVKEILGRHGEGGYINYSFNAPDIDPANSSTNSRLADADFDSLQTMQIEVVTGTEGQLIPYQGLYGNGHLNDTLADPQMLPSNLSYSMDREENFMSYPYVPQQVDLVGGKLLEKDTYDASGNVVTTVTNNYNTIYHENFWIRGMKVYLPKLPEFQENGLSFYKLHTGITHLISSTKKTYNGSNYVTETSYYGYESPFHTLKTTDSTITSQGDQLVNKTYYSFDYANTATPDSVFKKMKAMNLLVPISTQKWKDGTLVDQKVTQYADFTEFVGSGSLLYPSTIYSQESPTPLNPAAANESMSWHAPVTTLLPNSYLVPKATFVFDGYNGTMINQQLTNDKSQGIKWSSDLRQPLAVVDNATNTPNFNNFYYEGFEDVDNAALYYSNAHTGNNYQTGPMIENWIIPDNRSYVISYWYLLNGKWLFSPEQPYTGNTVLTGGTGYDDIRIHPVDASMTTYTYDRMGDVTSITDPKGLTTYYEYDSFQRLQNIRDKYKNIIKNFCYNYAGQAAGCSFNAHEYYNTEQDSTFGNPNCGAGKNALATYSVADSTYTSDVSQENADSLAKNEILLNGRRYAALHSVCAPIGPFQLSNTTNTAYQVNFYNATNNLVYNFLNSGTSTVQVPIGTYSVEVYPVEEEVIHTLSLTNQTTVSAPRTTFTNVVVTATGTELILSVQ